MRPDTGTHINYIQGPKFWIMSNIPKSGNTAEFVHTVTVDSGACESIAPVKDFSNTNITTSKETGKVYGACGGEAVKNIGCKNVQYITREGKKRKHVFQIGDKIARSLLAVSQECAAGRGI